MIDQPYPMSIQFARGVSEEWIAKRICVARDFVLAVKSDSEICAVLASVGYEADHLKLGLACCKAAQLAFAARQYALCSQRKAEAALQDAHCEALLVYQDFRGVARLLFLDPSSRTTLRLNQEIPEDVRSFIAFARSSYQAASAKFSFRCQLSQYGSLEDAAASLEKLILCEREWRSSRKAAQLASARLHKALVELEDWLCGFYNRLDTSLTGQPELRAKLGLGLVGPVQAERPSQTR